MGQGKALIPRLRPANLLSNQLTISACVVLPDLLK